MKTFRRLSMSVLMLCLLIAAEAQAQSYHNVTFQAQSGHFVVAENGGGSLINADRTAAGPWEAFEIVDYNGGGLESGDIVAVRTVNGAYIRSSCFTVQTFLTSSGFQTCSSEFWIDKYDNANVWQSGPISTGDQVAFSGGSGLWQAVSGGGGAVRTDAWAVGAWEKFFITF